MIRAVVSRRDAKIIDAFEITGHADSGEYGQDIVCAAVSVLTINTVNSLTELAEINPEVEMDKENGGLMKVKLAESELSNVKGQLFLESLVLGLQSIEQNYQDYIELTLK
ncbi:ribosomal-processing cysteine protease Prp [Dellaglioa algida]|uniref:ribosomal-processing cysteine protease Prp n=1 Tax=Dellaglioa algida TaxID=105612 RepID=UPI0024C4E164|nr:ribosomal-processing cysteine protease Prp [Dellaglioa algida]MDK1727434.1 ribosomal-processing cysteine protease Prp [Dellaglioa algida]MDK1735440.1 ribosomal-processing cysteine protease Prp [Dellaglioa algida]MDK1736757.1 ribosomal-processing cysteine protease Prp [Dellaglioa algida]